MKKFHINVGLFIPGIIAVALLGFEVISGRITDIPEVRSSDIPAPLRATVDEVSEVQSIEPAVETMPLTHEILDEAPFSLSEAKIFPAPESVEPEAEFDVVLAEIESESDNALPSARKMKVAYGIGDREAATPETVTPLPSTAGNAKDRSSDAVIAPRKPVYDDISYRIRPGDLLDVFVWGQTDLSQTTRVARDGSIVVRLAGSVRLTGLTVNEASSLIRTRLSRYLVEPNVTVSIAEFGGKDILVVGEVVKPGPITIDRPTSLLDVLIQADWKRGTADISSVRLVRADSAYVYNIEAVLLGKAIDQNVLLEPGDLVVVPSREQVINLLGAFAKTGKYVFPINRRLTVKDLLLESSAWSTKADITRAFILHPDGSMNPVDINALWFRGDATQNLLVKHDDSLVIPEIAEIGVYILGEVSRPGLYKQQGEFHLLQAITLAVPSNFRSKLADVRVVRGWPDHPRVFTVDVKRLLKGDLKQNMQLETGDVIYIPQGIISYTLDFWNQLLTPISGTGNAAESIDDIRTGDFDNN